MQKIRSAIVVLPCQRLQENLEFFTDRLGFRLERISPADNPRSAEISGHGLRIELRVSSESPPATIRLTCDKDLGGDALPSSMIAPNGTRIEFAPVIPALDLPPIKEELVISRREADAEAVVGRAGMRYRDLIPGRLGGRFIASHIQIPDGGEVPDFVHFHQVRFQMIFCVKGWVRVLYEDQGEAMLLEAGDCFLQPPLIRHRVLESSEGLKVVEIACPAEHDTFIDHELELPTAQFLPERDFEGQRFVHHRASVGRWIEREQTSFECRDLDIAAATAGLASAQVLRVKAKREANQPWSHEGELLFLFVLDGQLELRGPAHQQLLLRTGDSATLPSGSEFWPVQFSDELQLLEVKL
ncbi:MAG: quercetin dioxygenase-like cupin family protein [Planctomycetota bacterium]|jgi:quercetin dioxygenase-like cupin family protein